MINNVNKRAAYTNTYNFRVLANGFDSSGHLVKYTSYKIKMVSFVSVMQPNDKAWAGLHLMGRYQTEDDFYVGSFRKDGKCTIKKKVGGVYSSLKTIDCSGYLMIGQQVEMDLKFVGNNISFYLNKNMLAWVNDNSLSWGTAGIRSDYVTHYITTFKLLECMMNK